MRNSLLFIRTPFFFSLERDSPASRTNRHSPIYQARWGREPPACNRPPFLWRLLPHGRGAADTNPAAAMLVPAGAGVIGGTLLMAGSRIGLISAPSRSFITWVSYRPPRPPSGRPAEKVSTEARL